MAESKKPFAEIDPGPFKHPLIGPCVKTPHPFGENCEPAFYNAVRISDGVPITVIPNLSVTVEMET